MKSMTETDNKWVGFDRIEKMKGYERIEHIPGSTFKESSIIAIVPTRGQEVKDPETGNVTRQPFLHQRIFESLQNMIWPMNQKRVLWIVSGDEVGKAYTQRVHAALQHPELSTWKYVLCIEDDMLIPQDAVPRLLEAIEAGPFDAVGGMYWTRGDYNMPMIYGNAQDYSKSGKLDFAPLDPRPYLANGGTIVECNGIAMGCSLYRMDLFKEMIKVHGPDCQFFQTISDLTPNGPVGYTQDLEFCAKAKRMGKRFAVDCRVKCGHMDLYTGEVF